MSESVLPDDPVEYFRENPDRLRNLLDDDDLGPKLRKFAESYGDSSEVSSS